MLKQFAVSYRLKIRRDSDLSDIVQGRDGQIFEFSQEQLGVMFMPSTICTKKWNSLRKQAILSGMTLQQNGDSEGSFSFNADNSEQVAIALKIARPKRRKQLSPESRAKLLRANQRTRFVKRNTVLEGRLAS
jgi:hypothetical protein